MDRRNFCALATLPALAGLEGFSSNGKTIPSSVVTKGAAHVTKLDDDRGDQAVYFDGKTPQLKSLSIIRFRIRPGKSPHDVHTHPEEVLVVVAEGTGQITIDGKPFEIAPGTVWYCAGNVPHGVYNSGDVDLVFYTTKWKA